MTLAAIIEAHATYGADLLSPEEQSLFTRHVAELLLTPPSQPFEDTASFAILEELAILALNRADQRAEALKPTAKDHLTFTQQLIALLKEDPSLRSALKAAIADHEHQLEQLRQQRFLNKQEFIRSFPNQAVLLNSQFLWGPTTQEITLEALLKKNKRSLRLATEPDRPKGSHTFDLESLKALNACLIFPELGPQGFSSSHTRNLTCPFHSDRTPSLHLYRSETPQQALHCFQCGFHGSLIDFTMRIQHSAFLEACRFLSSYL